ncbi:MAG: anhydro-N-acetylmuramic acid kinase [Flavobacteriales bacterium]|nr:anhydro-N-acetylmuramic acid kinase [Flavobacteriales bacterium]
MSDKKKWEVLGLMSGTSLDGLDIAHIHFKKQNKLWTFELLEVETYKYDEFWFKKLSQPYDIKNTPRLNQLDIEYGDFLGEKCNFFCKKHQINPKFICSHGHTIFHQPELGYTLQVGNGQRMASKTNRVVINNFRMQDVRLGGQGAPLVPIGDLHLFKEYNQCLNLGGFANISTKSESGITAYDICPVNIVLNQIAQTLGKNFDHEGLFARSGNLIDSLLEKLNQLGYYKARAPKSLGKEWVNDCFNPIFENANLDASDLLATLTEHMAIQIACSFKPDLKVLCTGGGAYNTYLIERIKQHSTNSELIIPNQKIVEYKEALIFGFLGVLRLEGELNCLSSVTGAQSNHSSGVICRP